MEVLADASPQERAGAGIAPVLWKSYQTPGAYLAEAVPLCRQSLMLAVARDLDVLPAHRIAYGLHPIGRGLVDDHLFLHPRRFPDYGFLVGFGDFDGAVGEVGVGDLGAGCNRAALDRDALGTERHGLLDRCLNNESPNAGGAAIHEPLADSELLLRKRNDFLTTITHSRMPARRYARSLSSWRLWLCHL